MQQMMWSQFNWRISGPGEAELETPEWSEGVTNAGSIQREEGRWGGELPLYHHLDLSLATRTAWKDDVVTD